MPNFDILTAISCFIVAALVDVVWALYIRRTNSGNAFQSSLYAGLIMGLGSYNTISFVENHTNLIFVILGAIVGTYIVVKMEHKKVISEPQTNQKETK